MKESFMKPTIKCGKQKAEHCIIEGSVFHDTNLSKSDFNDVNLSKIKIFNANMSDIKVSAAQMGGAKFKEIGLPPGADGKQRPISFELADLNGLKLTQTDLNHAKISKCDLSHAKIEKCHYHGMTIEGILVTDLLKSYKRK